MLAKRLPSCPNIESTLVERISFLYKTVNMKRWPRYDDGLLSLLNRRRAIIKTTLG